MLPIQQGHWQKVAGGFRHQDTFKVKSYWENCACNHIRPSWWIHEWVADTDVQGKPKASSIIVWVVFAWSYKMEEILHPQLYEKSMLSWKRIRFKVVECFSFSRPPLYQNQICHNRLLAIDHLQHSLAAEDNIRDAPNSWSPRVLIWDSVDEPGPKICLYNGKQVTNPVTKCMWKYMSPTQPVKSEPSQGHTLSRALGGIHLPDVFLPGIPWSCKNWIFQSNELPGYRLESRISRYITWPLHIDMWHIPKTKGLNSVPTSRGFAQFTLSEKGPSQR